MATKKKSSKKKANGLKLINLKITPADHAKLLKKAQRFESGNLSALLRRAGLAYNPKVA